LGLFNQVILNMIVNAAHAIEGVIQGTSQNGLISITSRQIDTWAEIHITDMGTGMPEDIQHKSSTRSLRRSKWVKERDRDWPWPGPLSWTMMAELLRS
jgi:signal transduction histidine kinase